ncbi:MAG: hypothetical protein ACQES9_11985 [Myxococcota bacterium]
MERGRIPNTVHPPGRQNRSEGALDRRRHPKPHYRDVYSPHIVHHD